MSNSELLAEEAIAFALEGADELERLGNREQSLVGAVPAIVADERQREHIKVHEGEARRWFRLAKAVRQVADRTQLDELRAENEKLRAARREWAFVWKWIERAGFDASLSREECIDTLLHYPGAPWTIGRWDVDHKPYAKRFYAAFPNAARKALGGTNAD